MKGIYFYLLVLGVWTGQAAVSFGPLKVKEDASVELRMTANAGKNYVVEASIDLVNWSELFTVSAASAELVLEDTRAISFTRRFYRAMELGFPPNDSFETRWPLSGASTGFLGHNFGATEQAGEPEHAYFERGSGSVWWTWTAPATGVATLSMIGTYFDSMVAVYTGNTLGTLQVVAKKPFLTKQLEFDVVAGTTYQIAVDGNSEKEGLIRFTLEVRQQTAGIAPVSLSGLRINLIESSDPNTPPRVIQFSADGKKWTETVNGEGKVIEVGNVLAYGQNGASATLKLEGVRETELLEYDYVLDFRSASAGRYRYTLYGELRGSGEFSDLRSGTTDLAPATLAGRNMATVREVSSSGAIGQSHFFAFGYNGMFHDSDGEEHGAGRYSYTPSGSTATLVLDYTGSADFIGDKATMQMTFTTTTEGRYASKYRRNDGAMATIEGRFVVGYQ